MKNAFFDVIRGTSVGAGRLIERVRVKASLTDSKGRIEGKIGHELRRGLEQENAIFSA